MVERLCSQYGTRIDVPPSQLQEDGMGRGPGGDPSEVAGSLSGILPRSASTSPQNAALADEGKEVLAVPSPDDKSARRRGKAATSPSTPAIAPDRPYYAFPTLDQLARATEEDLRAAGFG